MTLANDGGRWVFEQFGSPLPFERVDRYRKHRIVDRFTFDDLRDYTAALGILPFSEDYYRPADAQIVEIGGTATTREFSHEEVQGGQ